MIKFFRRIRQRLLSENRLGKYLLYAIGEIILVVIGILIALQINNANEAKANEERFLGVLQEIKTDLTSDVQSGRGALWRGKEKDSLLRRVLNGELTAADYQNNEDYSLFWLGLNYEPFQYQKSGFAKFENFTGVIPEAYEQVARWISHHYTVECPTFDDSHNGLIEGISKRQEFMALNYPWFNQLQHQARTEEIIDFYLNDPIYMNWIFQSYQFSTTGSNTAMVSLQNSAFRLLILIADLQGEQLEDAEFFTELLGTQLTQQEKEVAGTYIREVENGWTFALEVKAGYLMYDGEFLLKKIEKDKYQSADYPDWFYETVRDDAGNVVEFIMNDTGNGIIYNCAPVE